MRRLFGKVFKDFSKVNDQPVMSLPSELEFTDINSMTKRGFLAKKLSKYVGLGTDRTQGDYLFYLSFSKKTFHNPDNENELVLFLSELMLKWSEQNEDIPLQINQLDVENETQNAMLKAFEIYKKDLFRVPDPSDKKHEMSKLSRHPDEGKWEVYRDVILAATQGKFTLLRKDEINGYIAGDVFCEGTIKNRSDIPKCRNRAKESLESKDLAKTQIMSWLLVLSEAITNTIKHAEEGKMTLIENVENNEIRFVIEDKGPGFLLSDLPQMTLLAGYSTKKSMGQGFTLMMKMAKHVALHTSQTGSTIILTFDSSKEKEKKFDATG
ncbi:ATP-binding protein [Sporosarcina sp. 179-K 8C2 HS]|uniref:ATP-binding protein n=1 Tax=Sporosarcina sp. 179-K 8C2 HS TaxID=3142387 RepID=UPI00399F96FF